ncbi:SDR family oxidoreductase [Actinophytocola sp.]|uniref:SDR family oxidoreductase n=1 Tax=Actinophytocola sp. TaxID=1872138 RepID=UPI002D7E9129|nr:SDR family oxidoreductase [Actinophytocola sp.]HET9139222.1 SDR family oxidoreductase [Actinophytocola sp.]
MSRTALVTGASKGLGYQTVRLLGERGITAIVGARDEERGRSAARELGAPFVQIDVTDPVSVEAAAKWIEHEYETLDILVNNAGITVPHQDGLPSMATLADLRRVFETNVFGVVAVTTAMLPMLLRSEAGRIVNVSSDLGSMTRGLVPGTPQWAQNNLPYSASKAALNMVTVAFAKELWDTPVKVNAESPGFCATDINNFTGFRTAEQGAQVAVRLATLPAGGPTGGFFDADGEPIPW